MTLHPDFRRVIERLLLAYLASSQHDTEDLRLARKYDALPLGLDFIGHLLLHPDGYVIYVPQLDEEDVLFENAPNDLTMALLYGSRRFDELRKLLPERSAESRECSTCGGSGFFRGKIFCRTCGGLGWVEPE